MHLETSMRESPIACFKEISSWVSSVFDLDNLLELIIDTATRIMQAKASSLLLLDHRTKKLFFKVATGDKKEEVRQYEINVGEGIAGLVAQKGRPLLVPDVRKDPRWSKKISESIGFQTGSIACVPMKTDGKTIGVVEIIDKEDGSAIRHEDMMLLTAFAELAAMVICRAQKIDQVTRENINLKQELGSKYHIIGESEALKKVISDGYKVANSKSNTLILGESGTGKELLARLIHQAGPRKDKPMIVLNCAALPETLLEDELFGHEKGSFTGAIGRKIGKFELADGSTLFLDEIGELTPAMQAKWLRVLEEGVFYRIGGNTQLSVDVRIISATNKDLAQEVAEGRFREDLYYRLNVIQIRMPSLRERGEDIPLLVTHFLNLFRHEIPGLTLNIPEEAMRKMMGYHWPGNVRELKNAVERAAVMGNGGGISSQNLILPEMTPVFPGLEAGITLKEAINRAKKEFIKLTLKQTSGNRSEAAKIMGVQRTYLSRLISQYGL